MSTLAERLRELIAENGVDQRTFGIRAGLSHAFASAYFQRAKRDPNASIGAGEAAAIARAWRVSLPWLVSNEGPKFPDPVLVLDDRYPNRAKAVEFMRDQVSPEAIDRILSDKMRSHVDLPAKIWADMIWNEEERIRWENAHPAELAEEDRAAIEREDAIVERTTPPLATKKLGRGR